jgi:kynurenine formamidase
MPDAPPLPSSSEMAATYEAVKNWGRWDGDRGALALLTPEHRVAAAALVRSGVTVSLAHDLATGHAMQASGADRASLAIPGYEAARDHLATDVHGVDLTHIDALCHMFVDGLMFNGLDAELVTDRGAERNSIMEAADGIVGRGVLLDVPAARDVAYLTADQHVTVADLGAAEAAQGSPVRTGDLLIVSTGRDARRAAHGRPADPLGEGLAGLHPECLAWLHDRSVALLAGDGISDPLPAGPIDRWPFPIHQVAITGMGLMLVDNLRLDEALAACAAHQRWEFLLTVAPLRLPGGTGSPVNPIAIF